METIETPVVESPIELQVYQLTKVPDDKFIPPSGHRLEILHFNTDNKTKIKPKSQYWIIPQLVDFELPDLSPNINKLFIGLVEDQQRLALKEFSAGDLDYLPMLTDLDSLAKDYLRDGRGERDGIKQSAINQWLTDILTPYIAKRIDRNLAAQTEKQRGDLVNSFANLFAVAATRGNKKTTPNGVVFVSLPKLEDLLTRLESYLASDGEWQLPASLESGAMLARLRGHIVVLKASMEDKDCSKANF